MAAMLFAAVHGPLLHQADIKDRAAEWPLLAVRRTSRFQGVISHFDPADIRSERRLLLLTCLPKSQEAHGRATAWTSCKAVCFYVINLGPRPAGRHDKVILTARLRRFWTPAEEDDIDVRGALRNARWHGGSKPMDYANRPVGN